jgi:hypothetical protein
VAGGCSWVRTEITGQQIEDGVWMQSSIYSATMINVGPVQLAGKNYLGEDTAQEGGFVVL